MPKLRCSAQSCIHNAQEACCRGEIKVAGESAEHSEHTCCSNFYENLNGAQDAAVSQEPTLQMAVACEAKNCAHNNGGQCYADYIDVSGYNACRCDDTCCSSFYPRQ